VALIGVVASDLFALPVLDGVASVIIGVILALHGRLPGFREPEPADRRGGRSGHARRHRARSPPPSPASTV
jgi:hypothetical protein